MRIVVALGGNALERRGEPKAEAAAAFASATGMPCVCLIGALDELPAILAGEAGTRVDPDVPGLEVTRTRVPMTTGEAA